MEVRFSDHAAARCRTRGISMARVEKEAASLPPCSTYMEWTIPGNIVIGVADKDGVRTIVTVFRKTRHRKRVAH